MVLPYACRLCRFHPAQRTLQMVDHPRGVGRGALLEVAMSPLAKTRNTRLLYLRPRYRRNEEEVRQQVVEHLPRSNKALAPLAFLHPQRVGGGAPVNIALLVDLLPGSVTPVPRWRA